MAVGNLNKYFSEVAAVTACDTLMKTNYQSVGSKKNQLELSNHLFDLRNIWDDI